MSNPTALILAAIAVVWAYYMGAATGREQGLISAAEASPAMESYFSGLDDQLRAPSEADEALAGISEILQVYDRNTADLETDR